MVKKLKLASKLNQYNLCSQIYYPNPPEEIDEFYYYFDEVLGDGRGLE